MNRDRRCRIATGWNADNKEEVTNSKLRNNELTNIYRTSRALRRPFHCDCSGGDYRVIHPTRGAISRYCSPTVQVYTAYDGASAETVQKSVIAPLEEAINGVEDMTYMTSSASNAGSAEITIYFKQGTNPDMAAVNVQNRVSKAAGQLPAEVTRVGVSVNKRQNGMLQIFTLHSPDSSLDENFSRTISILI